MGFTFTVTQALLIRELLVAFFGNELSIGLILACWLILEATGSGLLGRLARRWGRRAPSFAVLQVLFALFLPLCLYAASISRSLIGAIPGEGVGLIPMFISSFLILMPLALVDGAMFTFGCRAYSELTAQQAPSIGRVYVYEAVGAIIGGVGGVLHELGKYPLTQIDYAELDPLLIEAVKEFHTPLTLSELGDPRVRVEHVDGRLLVRERLLEPVQPKKAYDLVLVNLPYPSTLQLNRFYTVEFFQMVRSLLSKEGVLVLASPASLTYMSDELQHLNRMFYRTLQQAFPHVRPIPGDLALWLASPSDDVSTATAAVLLERWQKRGLETKTLTAPPMSSIGWTQGIWTGFGRLWTLRKQTKPSSTETSIHLGSSTASLTGMPCSRLRSRRCLPLPAG